MPDHLLALAANPMQTPNERAAALSCAARLTGAPMPDWPDPPPGWAWQGGELMRAAASSLLALRWRKADPWTGQEPPALPAPEPPAAVPRPLTPRTSTRSNRPDPTSGAGVVVEMVMRPEGATLEELIDASGLSMRSVRGVLSLYLRGEIEYDRSAKRYVSMVAA